MSMLEILLFSLSVGGHPLVAAGDRRGYWMWLTGSAVGSALFMSRGMYLMAGLQVVQALMNAHVLLRRPVSAGRES